MPSKEERMRMCIVRWCTREVTSTVSKKWLIRLRKKLNAKKVRALFEQSITVGAPLRSARFHGPSEGTTEISMSVNSNLALGNGAYTVINID